ncbi:hypothetical protein [Microtetraspora glauca]|uniref:DUF4360 domain-containing protein n=1 Tax=Microtetraspora glauca TaxID=1996 RepID=A0ABV3GTB9_MICGL
MSPSRAACKDTCTYSVQVADSTDFVRNTAYKADILSTSITWTITGCEQ